MKRLVAIVLFLAVANAAAQIIPVRRATGGGGANNEQVLPNDNTTPAGTGYWRCTSDGDISAAGCLLAADIDEGYQGVYDGNADCNDENVTPLTEELRIDFATPSASPTATFNAQQIRVTITKTNATCTGYQVANADPTFDIYVWDGDSLETLATNVDCGGWNQNEVSPYSWTYEGGSDGSEVYVEIFDDGNGEIGTSRRRCSIEAIDWYAEVN